jgi:hypothetical protein
MCTTDRRSGTDPAILLALELNLRLPGCSVSSNDIRKLVREAWHVIAPLAHRVHDQVKAEPPKPVFHWLGAEADAA